MAEARAAASQFTVQPPRRPQTAASTTTAAKRPHRTVITLSAPPLRSSDSPILPPELDIIDRQLDTTSSSNNGDVAQAQEWVRPASSPCKSTASCGSELEQALSLVSTCAQHNGQGTPLRSRRRHRSPPAAAKQQRAKSAAPAVTKRSDATAAAAAAEAKTVVRLHDVFLAYSSGQGTPPRSKRWHRKANSANSNSGTTAAAAVPTAIAAAPSSSSGAVTKPHRPVTAPAGTRGAPRPGRAHVAPKA
jgi:hypothetical protein